MDGAEEPGADQGTIVDGALPIVRVLPRVPQQVRCAVCQAPRYAVLTATCMSLQMAEPRTPEGSPPPSLRPSPARSASSLAFSTGDGGTKRSGDGSLSATGALVNDSAHSAHSSECSATAADLGRSSVAADAMEDRAMLGQQEPLQEPVNGVECTSTANKAIALMAVLDLVAPSEVVPTVKCANTL